MSQAQHIAGLDVYIEGAGEQTIVMLHGWPDTYQVWDAQVAAFAADYRCVRITLPNYAEQGGRTAYSIDAVAEKIAQALQIVSPDQPVILLLHDWGCVFGYRFYQHHPERVSRMIALDIGDAASKHHLKSLKLYQLAMLGTRNAWHRIDPWLCQAITTTDTGRTGTSRHELSVFSSDFSGQKPTDSAIYCGAGLPDAICLRQTQAVYVSLGRVAGAY
jgi:pimeloyl-ACP methyl ester carboxylesterase